MAAAATDLFQEVGLPGTATTLSSPGYTVGNTSITVGSTANMPTGTGFTFVMDQVELVNNVEVRVDGTYNEFVGTVGSGTTITSISKEYGDAQDYPAGSRVYILVSSERENRLVEGILTHADQDGTLKAGAVDVAAVLATDVVETAKIKNLNVTTAKLAENAVTASKLATDAITLGYAENSAGFATSETSPVQVTDLTTTVTIPAGGRKIKITVWTGGVFNSIAATNAVLSLWDGTVGSGTKLVESYATSATASAIVPCSIVAIVTPAAGSKTYNVGFARDNGATATLRATPTSKAFILVEAI